MFFLPLSIARGARNKLVLYMRFDVKWAAGRSYFPRFYCSPSGFFTGTELVWKLLVSSLFFHCFIHSTSSPFDWTGGFCVCSDMQGGVVIQIG